MDQRIIILFQKYVNERCSKQELEEVFTILKNGQYPSEWQQVIADEAKEVMSSGMQSELTQADVDTIYAGIAARLPSANKKVFRLWTRIGIAAAAATVIFGTGLFFYKNSIQNSATEAITYKNDVTPGKVGATLTLANGQKIRLAAAANGVIAKQAGVSVRKTANGQLIYEVRSSKDPGTDQHAVNTLTTAKGEIYLLTLPDNSKVWMNSASSITYSANLIAHGSRRVKLEGEAYFEIAKDKAHPFVVESRSQEVEVLGTHFNVNSYADEPAVATTLLEGSVKVTSVSSSPSEVKETRVIKPGEEALNNGSGIKVTTANIENNIDWKQGDFFLNHVNFKTAMRKIARWYDVEIVYDSSVPNDIESGGWISRDKNLSSVLKLIESSGLVHFKVEGKKIYVTR